MPQATSSILVVDDEDVIRELLTDILEQDGYAVETAPSGRDALNRLRRSHQFSVLLTDIMMPEMDGIELVRKVLDVAPDIVSIVMTGYATLDTARAAVQAGAYDYVLKPFSLSEIRLSVANALERRRIEQENVRLRELTDLFSISQKIATYHDQSTLLDYTLQAALSRVGAERGSVMLLSPDGASLDVVASIGLPDEFARATADAAKSISGWVARNNQPLCVRDIQDHAELAGLSLGLGTVSFVSVPLERNLMMKSQPRLRPRESVGPVIAVMNVCRKRDRTRFTDSDLAVLSIIGNHAAAALENVQLLDGVEEVHLATLQSMALALEAKDLYTHGHSERVRNYSVVAAMKLGMSKEDIERVRLGAMLHDVGKIGVSDTILNKVDKLTDEEWEQVQAHPVIGYDVLKSVSFLSAEHLALVRSHHERLDGSGYPDGLQGDAIDPRVRILAVADTYDTMAGDRAYRKGMSDEAIVEELRRCADETLDGEVARLFIDMILSGEIRTYYDQEPMADS